jgi:hypothetical protein
VASKYYSDNMDVNKMNMVITNGTPYEGAPVIVEKTLSGKVLGSPLQNLGLSVLGGLDRDVKVSLDSLSQLTPTKGYALRFPAMRLKEGIATVRMNPMLNIRLNQDWNFPSIPMCSMSSSNVSSSSFFSFSPICSIVSD